MASNLHIMKGGKIMKNFERYENEIEKYKDTEYFDTASFYGGVGQWLSGL